MAQQSSGKDGEKTINPFQLSGSTSSTNLFGANSGNSLFGKSFTSTPQTQQTGNGKSFSTFCQGQTPVGNASFGLPSNANVGTFGSSFGTSGTQVHAGGLFSPSVGASTAVSSAQLSSFGTKTFGPVSKASTFGTTNFGISSSTVTGSGNFLSGSFTTVSSSLFGKNTTSVSSAVFGSPLNSTIGFTNTTSAIKSFGKDDNSESLGSKHPVFSTGSNDKLLSSSQTKSPFGVGFETTTTTTTDMSTTSQTDTGYGNFGSSQIRSEPSMPLSFPQPSPFGGAFGGKPSTSENDYGSTKVVPEMKRPFQGVDFNKPKVVQEISSVFGGAKDKKILFGVTGNDSSEKIVNLASKNDTEGSLRPSFIVPPPVPLSSNPFPINTPPVFGGGNTKTDLLTSKSTKKSKETVNIFGGTSSNTIVSGKIFNKTEGKISYSNTKKYLDENPSSEVEEGEIIDEQDELGSKRDITKSRRHKDFEEDRYGDIKKSGRQKGFEDDQHGDINRFGKQKGFGEDQYGDIKKSERHKGFGEDQYRDIQKGFGEDQYRNIKKSERQKGFEEDQYGDIGGISHFPESPDRKSITKIIVAEIPDSCFDKEMLRSHFSRFGKVQRVSLNGRSKQATIDFSDHDGASKAKRKGKKLHPKMPEVRIFYGTYVRRKSEEESTTKKIVKEATRTARRSISKEFDLDNKTRDYELDPYTPLERPGIQESRPLLRDNSIGSMLKKIKSKQSAQMASISKMKKDDIDHKGFEEIDHYKPLEHHISKKDRRQHFIAEERDELDPYIPIERPELSGRKTNAKSKKIIQRDIPDDLSSVKIKKNKQPIQRDIPDDLSSVKIKKTKQPIQRDIPDDLSSVIIKKIKQPRAASPSIREKETEVTNSTDKKSLENIIKSQSQNNNDRHNILKARDRLIRSEIIRSGEYLAATCPDMCPELERYKRDVQDYLSRYELTNDELDHKKVTKSFSRSSADKDEPLPWELRPGPVLNMTMDFLLCNVLPRVDNEAEDLKVWYGYLWDRTRAIRNDLMTQGLIDSLAVHIMERCCRFHIYCAVKFCDAPVSTMDPKMNSEHLSKSLLTLKDLYVDLGEKGVYFESESEFRAYDMLLNLNSGNIMDQYVLYRDDVRRSKEVQYAVEILHAVKMNNYVKFFKLVQIGTYLQGCILHRFFPQVRKDAISIIMKAYHTQKQRIPLSKIINILGFEDNEDAIVYLSHYGLECHSSAEATEDFVIIDKDKFIKRPTKPPPVVYPHRLIEASRNCYPAEIIQGGPLPQNPLDYHVPHDSFDSHGYMKYESMNSTDQLKFNYISKEKNIDDNSHPSEQQYIDDNRPSEQQYTDDNHPSEQQYIDDNHPSEQQYFDDNQPSEQQFIVIDTTETSEEVINEVVVQDLPTTQIIVDEPKKIPALTNAEKIGCMKDIFDWISSELFGELIRPVAQEALSAIKILYEKEAEKVVEELLFKNITEEMRGVAKSAINDITIEEQESLQRKIQEEEKKRRQLEELKSVAIDSVLSEYVSEFVSELSNSVASEAIDLIEEETLYAVLQELEKELPLHIEVQTVNEEIKEIAQLVINDALEQEEKVKEFQEKINRKICGQVLNKWRDLALLARRHKQSCEEFPARASQLSLEEQNNVLGWGYNRKLNENLGVTKITELHSTNDLEMKKIMLLKDIEKKVAWFTLSIPSLLKEDVDKNSSNNSASNNNLLNHCFKILIITTPSVDPVVLQWLRAKLNPDINADFTQPLKLCSSFVSKNTCLEYHVIMGEADLQVVYNDKNGETKGTNVAILVASEDDASGYTLQQMQCLLKDMEVPGTIIVFGERSLYDNIWYISPEDILNTKTSERLQCIIMKGWYNRNRNLSLHHNSFDDFVRNFIGDKVFDEAWKTHRERKNDFKSPLPFNAYVALYNQSIEHLIDVLKDKDLAYLSWPPVEASDLKGMPPSSWNGIRVKECSKWLKNGKLPSLNMEGYMTWNNIQSKVDTYIYSLGLSGDALQLLLHEGQRILESYMVPDEENSNWEIHVLSLPWIELTETIASYKLNHIPHDEVYYQPNKLNHFILPEVWYAACDSFDASWIQGRGHPRTKKRKGVLEESFQQGHKKTFKFELREAIVKEKEESAKIEKEREKEIEAINEELRLIYGMEI